MQLAHTQPKELRRTKILATLGPATDQPDQLNQLIAAGADAVRLNFSHGTAEDHERRAQAVQALSQAFGKEIAIIADLQGPKIRIARFSTGSIILQPGAEFILDSDYPKDAGTEEQVGVDYENLYQDVKSEDSLLLDDGRIVLTVKKVSGRKIFTQVMVGGSLSNNKGINRLGGGLSAKALTEKDKEDLKTALALSADYIAISFPRCAKDIHEAKALIQAAGGKAGVIAKIERAEALDTLDEIIHAADAVMVARGDLGVEIGDAELPRVQKHIIARARALNKPVITATQMMETMIHNTIPTRAEVFDVANAILDGTDAVMLSAETASGEHPAQVVATMARICLGAEKQTQTRVSHHRMECQFSHIQEAIAMSAMYAANHFAIRGIIALTESGLTPLLMSRIRSGIPIFAFTRHKTTQRKMALYRGVYPINCEQVFEQIWENDYYAVDLLKQQKFVAEDDYVLITHGGLSSWGAAGATNTLRMMKVKQDK